MKKVLAGIDLGIEGYDWLVGRAAAFSHLVDGQLDLLYVQRKPGDKAEYAAALEQLLQLVPAENRGEARVIEGSPLDTLAEQTRDYDTLVVGPREPGALERLLLGTMATRIIRRAECAVYIPRTDMLASTPDPAKLVAGVDLRHGNPNWLLTEAGQWAAAMGGTLDAAFAERSPASAIQDATVRAAAQREWVASREADRKRLQGLLDKHVPDAARGQAVLGTGSPQDALVAMSELYTLVLVGNREAGIADLLLGSVTHHVVRNALCDVLTLPSASA